MASRSPSRILIGAGATVMIAGVLVVGLVLGLIMLALGNNAAEQQRQRDLSSQLDFGAVCATAMISANGEFANPLVGRLSSPFGPRANPFGAGVIPPGFASELPLIYHFGADVAGIPEGTPFYAAQGGVVTNVGSSAGGNVITIDSGGGNRWLYVHAADHTVVVRPGQQVAAGDHLGGAGQTGAAKGVHLHLELRQQGKPIDPVPYLAAQGITLGAPTQVQRTTQQDPASSPALEGHGEAQGPITVPTPQGQTQLSAAQVRNAAAIIGAGRGLELPDQAIIVALMTGLQESRLLNLASPAVPESLRYDHDQQAVNKQSVGIFQQQHTMGWGSVKDLMNPEIAARTFFGGPMKPAGMQARGLLDLPGWETRRPGDAAQDVQRSGHPQLYHQWENTAKSIMAQIEGTTTLQCHTAPAPEGAADPTDTPSTQTQAQIQRSGEGSRVVSVPAGVTREDLVSAARTGVGGDYVWGQAEFRSWDSSGFVHWVYREQGIAVPRTAAWTAAQRTDTPKPGDIVAQQWNADRNRWDHVGIYVGQGRMISAVNPSMGTRDHPVVQTGEPVYFSVLGGDQ